MSLADLIIHISIDKQKRQCDKKSVEPSNFNLVEGKFETPQHPKLAKNSTTTTRISSGLVRERILRRIKEIIMPVENLVTMLMSVSSVRVKIENQ